MKTYLVSYVHRFKDGGEFIDSDIATATSQNEAVKNVAKNLLCVDSLYSKMWIYDEIIILSVTEIDDVDGFKDRFTQEDFEEEDNK